MFIFQLNGINTKKQINNQIKTTLLCISGDAQPSLCDRLRATFSFTLSVVFSEWGFARFGKKYNAPQDVDSSLATQQKLPCNVLEGKGVIDLFVLCFYPLLYIGNKITSEYGIN